MHGSIRCSAALVAIHVLGEAVAAAADRGDELIQRVDAIAQEHGLKGDSERPTERMHSQYIYIHRIVD